MRTFAAGATDVVNDVRLADVTYLVFAYGSGYDYFDGTTWRTSTKDAQFLVFWDDRLWGIDAAGQMWWSSALGTEEDEALLRSTVDELSQEDDAEGDLTRRGQCSELRGICHRSKQQENP